MPQKKGDPIVFKVDERPMDTTLEKMAKMRPGLQEGRHGDGRQRLGDQRRGGSGRAHERREGQGTGSQATGKDRRLRVSGGVDPAYMGLGPIPATRKLFKKLGLTIKDIDLVELNEAFAVQALACMKGTGGSAKEKCNLLGGGVFHRPPHRLPRAPGSFYSLAMQLKK